MSVTPSPPKNTAWRAAATLALLAAAVWGVYGPAIHTPFIYDDNPSILENPSITRLWPLVGDWQNPGPLNPPPDRATCGRPLVNLSFAVNYHFGGFDPVGYHLFNLALHFLSAALLAGIVFRTLHVPCFHGRFDRAASPLSIGVALVWAVHPLATEAVNYVTQRTELLMACCYLATLYASLRYWSAASPRGRAAWLTVASLACLAGMASKEVMVTAPVVVLLYERTFLTGSVDRAVRRSWPLYAGLLLGWVLLFWLNVDAPRGGVAGFDRIGPRTWWFTQCQVLIMYLKLVVWPWPLVIHYSTPLLRSFGAALPWIVPVVLLAVGTLVLLWRNSAVGFLAACVWLVLSPTLMVPIVTEIAAERRMYLPLAPLVALAIVGGYALLARASTGQRRWLMGIATAALIGIVGTLSLVSTQRLARYDQELFLWQDAQREQPGDPYVTCAVGYFLNQAGRSAEAVDEYTRLLQAHPDSAPAYMGLGLSLVRLGRPEEAVEPFNKAAELEAGNSTVNYYLGHALALSGQTDEAIKHLEQGLSDPLKLAQARNELGQQLLKVNRAAEARSYLAAAVRLKPEYAEAWFNLAQAELATGQGDAVATAKQALELARSQEKMDLVQQIESWLSANGAK